MSISLEQLRSALVDQADISGPAAITPQVRLDGVRRVLAARRHRRRGVTAGVLAVVLVGAVALAAQGFAPRHGTAPAHNSTTNPLHDGLPLYAYGGKQIGSARTSLKVGTTALFAVTPTSYQLTLAISCTDGLPGNSTKRPEYTILVNGKSTLGGTCGASSSSGLYANPAAYWKDIGIRLGSASQISIRITGTVPEASPPRVLSVALYQGVPLASYPLPAPPAHRETVEAVGGLAAAHRLLLGSSASNGTITESVTYTDTLAIQGATNAPGQIQVLIDGKVVDGHDSWDYGQGEFELDLNPDDFRTAGLRVPRVGQKIAVSVELSRFDRPSDWYLSVGQTTLSSHTTQSSHTAH